MSKTPKRPADLSELERQRICWRVSKGMPLLQAAAMEGISSLYADALVRDRDLFEQIETFKQRAADPKEERHLRLFGMALEVLEQHTVLGEHHGEPILFGDDIRIIN